MHRVKLKGIKLFLMVIAAFFVNFTALGQIKLELRVGVVLPLSGPLAFFGQKILQGVETALNIHNERDRENQFKVVVIKSDDRSSEDQASLAVRTLYQQERANIIFGSLTSVISSKLMKFAMEYKRPILIPAAAQVANLERVPYAFVASHTDDRQGELLAIFAYRHLRKRRAAILAKKGSAYSLAVARGFERKFKAKGGSISATVFYDDNTSDFEAKIEAIRQDRPGIVLMPGFYSEAKSALKVARNLGFKVPFLGPDGWDNPKLYRPIDRNTFQGSYFIGHFSANEPHPSVKEFIAYYEKLYNQSPDSLAAIGYEGMNIIIDAFKRADSSRSNVLTKELQRTSNAPGLGGTIAFDQYRCAIKSAPIMVVTSTGARFMTRVIPEDD